MIRRIVLTAYSNVPFVVTAMRAGRGKFPGHIWQIQVFSQPRLSSRGGRDGNIAGA